MGKQISTHRLLARRGVVQREGKGRLVRILRKEYLK